MALVTVQRSPSVTGSPQCSNSDGEADEDDGGKYERSECFFAGKGTAMVLELKDIPKYIERRLSTDSTRSTNSTQSNNSDIQQHLQSMFNLLGHEETLKMAVKLESQRPNRTRYLVIASRSCFRNGSDKKNRLSSSRCPSSRSGKPLDDTKIPIPDRQQISNRCSKADSEKYDNCVDDIEESCLLGIDCNEKTTIGLVVPILADTTIHLDGDGGFSVTVFGRTHIFKPVSVQAMWSALQTLHKVSQKARENNFYPGGPSHDWLSYYESCIESDQSCLNEWNAMDSLESRRPPSPDAIRNKPREKEETQRVIKMKLKEIMMSVDLDEVTSKYIRGRLEEQLDMDLGEYKSFIDEEMLIILGQMDAPTEIFDHVYLGSEWNASNLEELQRNGVRHILNVTREIDNFFPGMFDYFNVRVYDDEKTDLLRHWDNTYKYINRAKSEGSKVLVHCKMGVSRSASVVIAYAMKAYNWDFAQALQHVKKLRNCIKPNKNFLNQLETYRGMLDAMKNKEKLQRSKSETNLKSTKDARLLPGSEPTPLIQAWNQSKKSAGEKQRKLMRRSSSTSPKSIQSAIVVKQQSQSLENLTPEKSVADEPKNVRFPGSNGENYSVTQNQVLHIQKNTPTTSVKTIVSGLELELNDKKTIDDKKSLSLQIGRSVSVEGPPRTDDGDDAQISEKNLGSPVWTSSAKLITQTSNILDDMSTVTHRNTSRIFHRRESGDLFSSHVDNIFDKEETRQTRKTQSWAPNSVVIDPFTPSRQSSNSSVDSAVVLGYQGERRELPSRHSSWGSGDNRVLPSRNSSWGSYDTNRNTFHHSAIFEGQIQDLTNKTANKNDIACNTGTVKRTKQKLEEYTVLKKRCQDTAKQNVTPNSTMITSTTTATTPATVTVATAAELTAVTSIATTMTATITTTSGNIMLGSTASRSLSSSNCNYSNTSKKSSNLFRSQSATSRRYHTSRCNSEEIIVPGDSSDVRNSTQELSASAPDSYTMSDIESSSDVSTADVITRSTAIPADINVTSTTKESTDERISGNVQILKKNFEAKATSGSGPKKGQSLPSSPIAQHCSEPAPASTDSGNLDTENTPITSTNVNTVTSSIVVTPLLSNASTFTSESKDRNVKGLVNKYQSSRSHSNHHSSSIASSSVITASAAATTTLPYKARPRSYYESRTFCSSITPTHHYKAINHQPSIEADNHHHHIPMPIVSNSPLISKVREYNTRPPVPPLMGNHTADTTSMTDSILTHNLNSNFRRVQQHGKTHPLSKLNLSKQRFNTAAYNTM